MFETSFDKIAKECKKVSKCLRCWDSDCDMYIEVELNNPNSKYSDNYLLNAAKEIAEKYDDVIVEKPYFSSGSSYDSYIINLKLVEDIDYEYIQKEMDDEQRKKIFKNDTGRYPKNMDEFWNWAEDMYL